MGVAVAVGFGVAVDFGVEVGSSIALASAKPFSARRATVSVKLFEISFLSVLIVAVGELSSLLAFFPDDLEGAGVDLAVFGGIHETVTTPVWRRSASVLAPRRKSQPGSAMTETTHGTIFRFINGRSMHGRTTLETSGGSPNLSRNRAD